MSLRLCVMLHDGGVRARVVMDGEGGQRRSGNGMSFLYKFPESQDQPVLFSVPIVVQLYLTTQIH